MKPNRKMLLAGVLATGLSACATPTMVGPQISAADSAAEAARQMDYTFQVRIAEVARVSDVAFRLGRANQEMCPVRRPKLGLRFASTSDFKPPLRDASVRVLGLTEQLSVIHVAADSPAMSAGLQRGDVIVSFDGRSAANLTSKAFGKLLTDALGETSARTHTFSVRRGSDLRTVQIDPVMSCAYDVEILDESEINAYADGEKIYVTRALLKFVSTDEELALVLAHELAHNAQRHVAAKTQNATVAGLGGLALDILAAAGGINTGGEFTKAAMKAGAAYNSPEFEAEADYVGMYYLARAGYKTEGAENFWRKMAVESPKSIFVTSSHPATAARYLAIAATSREIEGKRAIGLALAPNGKGGIGAGPYAVPATHAASSQSALTAAVPTPVAAPLAPATTAPAPIASQPTTQPPAKPKCGMIPLENGSGVKFVRCK